jgi:anti-sigma factor RsiW
MQADRHDAMRQLIDKSLAGDASPQEQQSLREHLHVCEPCQKYADDGRRAIAGLSGFSFASDPGLQAKVNAALALRAQQLQATYPSRQRIVQVSLAALLLTILGSLGALRVGSPLAAVFHLQLGEAQAGVVTLWILPSLCFSLFLPVLLLLSARSAKAKGSVL